MSHAPFLPFSLCYLLQVLHDKALHRLLLLLLFLHVRPELSFYQALSFSHVIALFLCRFYSLRRSCDFSVVRKSFWALCCHARVVLQR